MAQTQIAIECPVSCRGAPDTLVWEASVSSAAGAFSQKNFLQRFETEQGLEEKLASIEFAQGTRGFDEQVVQPTLDQNLVLLSPFASADVRHQVIQENCLEPVEDQALLCQSRSRCPGKLPAKRPLEVQDDKLPCGSRTTEVAGGVPRLPSLESCSVPAHPAICALLLGAQPGERVLDLCGSGVKAAVLACCMFSDSRSWLQSVGHESGALGDGRPDASVLVSNAPDRTYVRSMEPWLQSLLPAEVPVLQATRTTGAGHILLSSVEAWQKQSLLPLQRLGPFDRIIVDPTCACGFGARMPDLKYPELAEALLCNAARLLRPGGILLYSTTRPEERAHDSVVRGLLRNAKEDLEVLQPTQQLDVATARTEHGQLLTLGRKPDQCKVYLCRLKRAT
ncbi:unnamed protein product [Symbiodinium sp. CCMP2592]|nr:unnamed protein product [Symbiodinium sp. CCMP2592]